MTQAEQFAAVETAESKRVKIWARSMSDDKRGGVRAR